MSIYLSIYWKVMRRFHRERTSELDRFPPSCLASTILVPTWLVDHFRPATITSGNVCVLQESLHMNISMHIFKTIWYTFWTIHHLSYMCIGSMARSTNRHNKWETAKNTIILFWSRTVLYDRFGKREGDAGLLVTLNNDFDFFFS